MKPGSRLFAMATVACLLPVGLIQSSSTATLASAPVGHANSEVGLAADAAGAAGGIADRSNVRLVSGRLPNGAGFVLPPVGQQPFPTPARLVGLPGSRTPAGVVDDVPGYVPQTSCDPAEKRGITAFKAIVMARYPGGQDWGSSRNCTDDGISEHLEGRAWDWNMNVNNATQFARAGQFLAWLTGNRGLNARRLGVMYIGYNHRIWGAYRSSEGWRLLKNSNPHTDHVHFSFSWNGATKATSFWSGRTFAEDYGPCQVYYGQPAPLWAGRNTRGCGSPRALPAAWRSAVLLWRGSTGARVTRAQTKLGVRPTTGFFGPSTFAAVIRFQRLRKIPVTGAIDARTWFALGMS